MSFLNKSKKEESSSKTILDGISDVFLDMLSENLGKSRLNQNNFFRYVVSDNPWKVDFRKGLIRFGNAGIFPIQFIGSESYSENTWRWSSSNISSFPEEVIEDAVLFTSSRTIERFPEIKPEKLSINGFVNGHNIASIIAAFHYEPVCYYRCPFEQGAAFILIKDLPDIVFDNYETYDVVSTIRELSVQSALNHRMMVRTILKRACESLKVNGSTMSGRFSDGESVHVQFDSKAKVSGVQTAS